MDELVAGCALFPEDELEEFDLHSATCGPPVFLNFVRGFRRWTGRAGRASTFQDGLADGTSGYWLGRLEEFSPHSQLGAKENSDSSPSLLYLFFITYAFPSSFFKVIKASIGYKIKEPLRVKPQSTLWKKNANIYANT